MVKPVINKKELMERFLSQEEQIQAFGVKSLGIFGSFARDKANEKSDIDVFVDIAIEHKTLKNFIALAMKLEEITGRKVELITPQSLNRFTGKYILNEVEYVPFAA